MRTSTEILQESVKQLKSIGCPESILEALWVWSLTVNDDDIKLRNWNAWAIGQLVTISDDTEIKMLVSSLL